MVGVLGPPRESLLGTVTPAGCDLLEPFGGAWVLCCDLDLSHTPYDVFWIGLRWTKTDRPTDQVLFLTPGGTPDAPLRASNFTQPRPVCQTTYAARGSGRSPA